MRNRQVFYRPPQLSELKGLIQNAISRGTVKLPDPVVEPEPPKPKPKPKPVKQTKPRFQQDTVDLDLSSNIDKTHLRICHLYTQINEEKKRLEMLQTMLAKHRRKQSEAKIAALLVAA